MTSSLNDAFRQRATGPYPTLIKIKVVARGDVSTYRGPDGELKKALPVAISDGTVVMLAKVYDDAKFARFAIGKSLTLRDVIRKTEEQRFILITKTSKVFVTAEIAVPDGHATLGEAIIHPPAAATVSLQVALQSPQKKRVSVAGKIVQEEATRTVRVKDEEVQIKVITLEAEKAKAKVTLWRDAVQSDARPGDFVTITDVVTNTYKGEVSLSTTSRTTVQKTEAPTTREVIEVVGVSLNEEGIAELLLADDSILTLTVELLLLQCPDVTNIEDMTAEGSVRFEVERKSSEVTTIAKL